MKNGLDNGLEICYTYHVMYNKDDNKTKTFLKVLESDYIKDIIRYNRIFRNESSLYDGEALSMSAKCIRSNDEDKQKHILDNIFEFEHCVLYNIDPTYGDCIMFIKELNMDEAEEMVDDALDKFERLYDEARKSNKSQSESSCLVYTFNNLIIKDSMLDCCVKYTALFENNMLYVLEYITADE
jgi:hypothetical protein